MRPHVFERVAFKFFDRIMLYTAFIHALQQIQEHAHRADEKKFLYKWGQSIEMSAPP